MGTIAKQCHEWELLAEDHLTYIYTTASPAYIMLEELWQPCLSNTSSRMCCSGCCCQLETDPSESALITSKHEDNLMTVLLLDILICGAGSAKLRLVQRADLTLTASAWGVISQMTETARRSTPPRRLQMSSVRALGSMSIRRCTRYVVVLLQPNAIC